MTWSACMVRSCGSLPSALPARGTELDANTAARGQLGDLGTESVENLVTVKGEAGDDTGGAGTVRISRDVVAWL